MAKVMRAIIVGGGIGGAALALSGAPGHQGDAAGKGA